MPGSDDLPRITDMLDRCHLCGAQMPVGEMTMNDDEEWECDDVDACYARYAAPSRPSCGYAATGYGRDVSVPRDNRA